MYVKEKYWYWRVKTIKSKVNFDMDTWKDQKNTIVPEGREIDNKYGKLNLELGEKELQKEDWRNKITWKMEHGT